MGNEPIINVLKTMQKILADNVRALRKERKLSQSALAERANLSLRGIQEIEYQNAWPELSTVASIARGLEVPDSRLFYDAELRPSPKEALQILNDYIEKNLAEK